VKDKDAPEPPRPPQRSARRPYSKPELTTYGPLAKLTRSTQSGTGEATPQGAMRMCL
jgi:hypothetical protein